jgi:phage tail sheath gpL-like
MIFNTITDSQVPCMSAEFDNSLANTKQQGFKTLLIGFKNTLGKANLSKIYQVNSDKQAQDLFGLGSNLFQQYLKYKKNDKKIEVSCIAVAEGDKEASTSLVFDFEDPTKPILDGVLSIIIFGEILNITINSTKDLKDICNAVVKEISNNIDITVTCILDQTKPNAILIKTIHKSSIYNDYAIYLNGYEDKPLPTNLKMTYADKDNLIITKFAGATKEYLEDIDALFKEEIKDNKFNLIVTPFFSYEFNNKMADILKNRWSSNSQTDGLLLITINKEDSNDKIFKANLDNLNCEAIIPLNYANSVSPTYLINAAAAAQIALSGSINPASPLQNIPLVGIKPPFQNNRIDIDTRNSQILKGVGSITTIGNTPTLERVVTSYKRNNAGMPDDSYQCAETMLTLSFLRSDFKQYFWTKYNRHNLAENENNLDPSLKILTPNLAKCEAIACFMQWEKNGLVQNLDDFIEDLKVELNKNNSRRLDIMMSPTLIKQLLQVAVQIRFK